jgi:NAD(P)H-dependent flavin oxidoreductase YrpB (nitropropane dioxygenase family)
VATKFDTPFCRLVGIPLPIVQAPIGGLAVPELAAAVSEAGGLGMIALTWAEPTDIDAKIARLQALTDRPFGVNLILRTLQEERLRRCIDAGARIVSLFWGDPAPLVPIAHDGGAIVLHTVGDVDEAKRAVDAGVDVVVAQGWEAGGHVRGEVSTMALVPAVVDAVGSTPVVAAGGIADGRGLVAALALGAQGILLGTRFLASVESPLHPNFKQAIVDSDGHDTQLSEIPDIAAGQVWPGAMTRSRRNKFVERWSGREWALRQNRAEAIARLRAARDAGDIDEGPLSMGQDAGLIHDIPPAADLVRRIAQEAEEILSRRLPKLLAS